MIDTSNLVCWHCGQQGHRRQECPELRGVQAHTEEPEGSPGAGDIELQDMNVLRLLGGSQESFDMVHCKGDGIGPKTPIPRAFLDYEEVRRREDRRIGSVALW